MPRGRKKIRSGVATARNLTPVGDKVILASDCSPSPATPPKVKKTPTKQTPNKITDYFSRDAAATATTTTETEENGFRPHSIASEHLLNGNGGTEDGILPLPSEDEIVYATAEELEEDGCSVCDDSGSGKENEDWRAVRLTSSPVTNASGNILELPEANPTEAAGIVINEKKTAPNSTANSSSNSPLHPRRVMTRSHTARFNLESPSKKEQLAESLSRLKKMGQLPGTASPPPPPPPLLTRASSSPSRARCDNSMRTPPNSPPTPHKIKLVEECQGTKAPSAAEDAAVTKSSVQTLISSYSPKRAAASANAGDCRKDLTQLMEKESKKAEAEKAPAVANGLSPKPATRKTTAKQQANDKGVPNGKLTDFFPIRRSERKPKNEIAAKQQSEIEAFLSKTTYANDSNLGIGIKCYEGKGRGIEAKKKFAKGDFVVEYAGELIEGAASAKTKEDKYATDAATGCYMYYFKHGDKHYCIDATAETGRLGRLVNHSRVKPNCITKVVVLNDAPRLILVAKTGIEPGTELLYDYGDRSKESLKAHPWLAL